MIWNLAAETMPRRARERLQLDRLRQTLSWAASRVPFYRERLARAGVTASAFAAVEELSRVPFTAKDDSADGTLQLGVRNSMSDATTWKTGNAKQASGRVPLRGRGHYIAFRRNIPLGSTWTSAKGVDFVQSAAGGPR